MIKKRKMSIGRCLHLYLLCYTKIKKDVFVCSEDGVSAYQMNTFSIPINFVTKDADNINRRRYEH